MLRCRTSTTRPPRHGVAPLCGCSTELTLCSAPLQALRDTQQELTSARERLRNLESQLSTDQRSVSRTENAFRDQLNERNTLLLTVYQAVDKVSASNKVRFLFLSSPFLVLTRCNGLSAQVHVLGAAGTVQQLSHLPRAPPRAPQGHHTAAHVFRAPHQGARDPLCRPSAVRLALCRDRCPSC